MIQSYLRGRKVESAQLLAFGKSNTNYRLELTGGEVCVARFHNPSANAKRENYILSLVQEIVPVPCVLAQGEDWSIHEFKDGTVLANAPECTRAAAEALARISSLRFASAGWIQEDGSIAPFDFGDGNGFVASMLQRDDVKTWLGTDAAAALLAIDAAQGATLSDGPCLVHGDFNPTNILVHNGIVTAILDWEFAHAGDRTMDIGNLLRNTAPAYHDQIEAGLITGGVSLPADWKRRAEMVDLGSHLEFLTTQRSDAFKQQCVRWVNGFIDRYACC